MGFYSSQNTAVFGATGTRNIVDPINGAQVGTVFKYERWII